MDAWLKRIPGLGPGPAWRRALAAAGYAAAAIVLLTAIPTEGPTPSPSPSGQPTAPPPRPPAPVPVKHSLVGTWHGQTTYPGLGVLADETIFGGDGSYSELTTSQYPGGTQVRATGDYTVDENQSVITVSHVKTCTTYACPDRRYPSEYILLQYTWIDDNTLRMQNLGCLNTDPTHCDPVTFGRVR